MAVLAPMKNTIPMNIGYGNFLNEPNVTNEESSFGLKFGFLKIRKIEVYSAQNYLDIHDKFIINFLEQIPPALNPK